MSNEPSNAVEPTAPPIGDDLTDAIPVAPDELPTDDDPEVVDGMAKLELLRQMEDIERLRE